MLNVLQIIGLMAATKAGVIGCNNALPWDYPDEMKHFRDTVRDNVIIMGRKTYDSCPKRLLEETQAIVMSRNPSLRLSDAVVFNTLDGCILYLDEHATDRKIFMIGGAEIAALSLENKLIDYFILTEIHKPYPGDVKLDLGYFTRWEREELEKTGDYTICKLVPPPGGTQGKYTGGNVIEKGEFMGSG